MPCTKLPDFEKRMGIDMDNTERKIREILKDIVDKDELKLKIEQMDNISFVNDLEFDSLCIIELVTYIEEEFGIEFKADSDCIEAFTDINSLREWVDNKVGGSM